MLKVLAIEECMLQHFCESELGLSRHTSHAILQTAQITRFFVWLQAAHMHEDQVLSLLPTLGWCYRHLVQWDRNESGTNWIGQIGISPVKLEVRQYILDVKALQSLQMAQGSKQIIDERSWPLFWAVIALLSFKINGSRVVEILADDNAQPSQCSQRFEARKAFKTRLHIYILQRNNKLKLTMS